MDGPKETQSFRTVLSAPYHPPYDKFIPAPGHGLGFNDLKAAECRHVIARILGEKGMVIDFEDGIEIERTVEAMVISSRSGLWVEMACLSVC